MNNNDTICAISTSAGNGAIAVIRLSGSRAFSICENIFRLKTNKTQKLSTLESKSIHYGLIFDNQSIIDDVLISLFKSPNSYTGEDIIEISCHGSLYIQQKICELLINHGARMARPGEFTQRAFLNGKLDLSQAEAVSDLISSSTESSHKLAIQQLKGKFSSEINKLRDQLLHFVSLIELELDFSEEDVEFADRKELQKLIRSIWELLQSLVNSFKLGNAIKNGIPVTIAGKTNAGKSTLLNLLLKEEKAIVSEIGGTTRDYIEDTMNIDGILFRFIDTAGLRHTEDKVEKMGIERTYQKIEQASVIIYLIDSTVRIEDIGDSVTFIDTIKNNDKLLILAINKIDQTKPEKINKIKELLDEIIPVSHVNVAISAKTGLNIDELTNYLKKYIEDQKYVESDIVVSNIRHYESLKHALDAIDRVYEGLQNGLPEDLLSMDLREAIRYLGEITGEITTDEILGNIFKNFCIGK